MVTAIFGNLVIGWTQKRNKEDEIALFGYKEYLSARLKNEEQVYDLIGRLGAATDDLITTTGFDPHQVEKRDQEGVRQQAIDAQKKFNAIDQEWRSRGESLGFMMIYYHHAQPGTAAAWLNMEKVLDAYSDCAGKWNSEHVGEHDLDPTSLPCQPEQAAMGSSLAELTKQLVSARNVSGVGASFDAPR